MITESWVLYKKNQDEEPGWKLGAHVMVDKRAESFQRNVVRVRQRTMDRHLGPPSVRFDQCPTVTEQGIDPGSRGRCIVE